MYRVKPNLDKILRNYFEYFSFFLKFILENSR